MKQPELGEHISEIRKERGYTQSELAQECNVDIRTIQRIETGEVTPRLFTLRIINEKLGTNFDVNGNSKNNGIEGSKTIIRTGWISGIIFYFFVPLLIFEAISYTHADFSLSSWPVSILILYNVLHFVVVLVFFRSIFFVGKYTRNTLIKAGAIISIFILLVLNTFKTIGIISDTSFSVAIHLILGSLVGITNVILGIGFVLTRFKKELSIATGAILIFNGLSFLHSGVVGIIFWSVSLIMLIIYLNKFEKLMA